MLIDILRVARELQTQGKFSGKLKEFRKVVVLATLKNEIVNTLSYTGKKGFLQTCFIKVKNKRKEILSWSVTDQ